MTRLASWWSALEDLLFPGSLPCPLCGQELGSDLGACKRCLNSLSLNWQRGEISGLSYFSLLPYQGFARDLIHTMKFQNGYQIAQTFGDLLAVACREELALSKVDLVLPVPLHFTRLTVRGFNQATILADSIGRHNNWFVAEQVVRTKNTAPQSSLHLVERQKNLQGAFALLPGLNLQAKLCLIVDDIITSAQTFQAMAQIVQKYGGKPLGVFLARTEISKE